MAALNPPTNLVVTRVYDQRFDLTWTNHSTSSKEYYGIDVWRSTNGAALTKIAGFGVAEAFTDNSTLPNHTYSYQIRAMQTGGDAPGIGAESDTYATTPAEPSALTAVRTPAGEVQLGWVNNAVPSYVTAIQQSVDGGAFSTGTGVSAGVTSWTDASAPSGELQYRLYAQTYDIQPTLISPWVLSSVLPPAPVPYPPVPTAPNNGSTFDATYAQQFEWLFNPADTSRQSKFQIQWRIVGAGSWTVESEVNSDLESYNFAGGKFANGNDYEWQVRTWGASPDPSPWSPSALFSTSAIPVVTILSPPAGTYGSSALTIHWGYFDAANSPQAQWYVVLQHAAIGGSTIGRHQGYGPADEYTLSTSLQDGESYLVSVYALNSLGQVSLTDSITLNVSYAPPAYVDCNSTYDEGSGTVSIFLTAQPDSPPDTVPATSVDVYRSTSDVTPFNAAPPSIVGSAAIDAYFLGLVTAAAGQAPAAVQVGPGTTTAVPGFTQYGPRAVISVFDVDTSQQGVTNIAGLGPVNELAVRAGAGGANLYLAVSPIGGGTAVVQTLPDLTDGRYVQTSSFNDGGTLATGQVLGVTKVTWGVSPTDGWTVPPDLLAVDAKGFTTLVTLAFTFEPSDTQRTNIMTLMKQWADARDAGTITPPDTPTDTSGAVWVPLAMGVNPDTTVLDTQPMTAGFNLYRLVAHSAIPTSRDQGMTCVAEADDTVHGWLSTGPSFEQIVGFECAIGLSWTAGRDKSLWDFAGRDWPVGFTGRSKSETYTVSAFLKSRDDVADLINMIEGSGPVLWRDMTGRRIYGQAALVSGTDDLRLPGSSAVTFTVSRTGYREPGSSGQGNEL